MNTSTAISIFFLQSGSVAKRLAGVSSRFDDGGAANERFLLPVLITLGLGLLALVGYRAFQWRRFTAVMGEAGFGLHRRLLAPLWLALDADSRRDPNRLLQSRELIAVLLESLAAKSKPPGKTRNRPSLVHEFLDTLIARNPDLREPRFGLDHLGQLERLRLRRDDGLVIDGFLRRVGQYGVDFVALEPPPQLPFQDEMVTIERAGGEEFVSRALRIGGLHGPWTLGVGDAAIYGHRREEFRVNLGHEGLAFVANPRLGKIRMDILEPPEPTHHLLAKKQAENPDTHESLLAKGQHFAWAQVFQFDDLSALGARIRITDPRFKVAVDRHLFLYLPFEVYGRREDYLIPAEVVDVWTQSLGGGEPEHVLRCRFFEIRDEEARAMRVLVNQIAGARDSTRGLAREILARYARAPAGTP